MSPGTRFRLGSLTREARDTLFLVAVVAWTLAPHATRLAPWVPVVVAALLLWRCALALKSAPLPGRWTVIALLAAAAALTWWEERTLLGKDAGVTLLSVLLALKMLELRARRDALVIFFLGFFVVLTHFLYSQSLLTAITTLLSVWGLLTALVLAHLPAGRPPLWTPARTALKSTLLGLPVMAALFVLFPRIGPLWGLPADALSRTGLSSSMRLGGIAGVARDESVALRVRFEGAPPPAASLYFRGPVLSRFDGEEWSAWAWQGLAQRGVDLELGGAPLRYEMLVSPSRLQALPLLEATGTPPQLQPPDAVGRVVLRPDLQWHTERAVSSATAVTAQAWPRFRHGARTPALRLRDEVELPPGHNPRTLQWAADLRRAPALAEADARTLAQAVLEHIRTAPFSYSLEPGPYGRDAVDEFWLDRRVGFCEHFAAAFVVVMRALDVPARVVTGYQGVDPTPVDGWWLVRQSHAHAWAEYWQPGEGWVRADPTAAVAPERVNASRNLVAPVGLVGQALNAIDPQWLARMRLMWDLADLRWTQWVLNYSRKQQFDLMKRMGVDLPDLGTLSKAMALLLAAVAAAGALWAWRERQVRDPWPALQAWVARRLAASGVSVSAHQGPRTRALELEAVHGAAAAQAVQALLDLEADRYARGRPMHAVREWKRRLRAAFQTLPSKPAVTGRRLAPRAHSLSLAVLLIVGGALATKSEAADPTYAGREDAQQFALEVAQRHGLSAARLKRQLAAARRLPAVQRLIMPPPAGTAKNWAAYRDRFVEPQRVQAGLRFWREHEHWLSRAEQRWGVPAWLVVGVIGVETFYGRHMGGFRVIDALATLSFDFPSGRSDRSAFFRAELEELLLLSHREKRDPATLKGSYAGAIGLGQFMPSSIARYAVDFDGDSHIDLFASAADAIGSVAHYLAAFGWEQDLPTHFELSVPAAAADLEHLLGPDIVPSFTAQQFAERGAGLPAQAQSHTGLLALVELQNGDAPPTYVAGTRNFYVITRYNWSSYYAMAVIELGQAVRQARP